MPIYYYTWTTLLAGESFSFRILERSEDTARQLLIRNIEEYQDFREEYEHFERQLCVNAQNQVFIEKKTLDAYGKGDEAQVKSLERALQMIHGSKRRLQYEKQYFLEGLKIDTSRMKEDVSPFSVHLDAVVCDENGKEMTLREFLLTAPTVIPVQKVEMYHNL
jgi:hypothetical protein